MKRNKLLTKRDALFIILILAIGLSVWGVYQWRSGDDGRLVTAEIRSDYGTHIVNLDEDRTFYIIPNVIFEIRDGQIAFVKSDCPDQVCVRTGFIGRAGQSAACLPNRLILSLSAADDYDNLDIYVR